MSNFVLIMNRLEVNVPKGPSINRLKGGRGGGQKLPILLSKKTTKRGKGVKNC